MRENTSLPASVASVPIVTGTMIVSALPRRYAGFRSRKYCTLGRVDSVHERVSSAGSSTAVALSTRKGSLGSAQRAPNCSFR
jgi:hypothetical protein